MKYSIVNGERVSPFPKGKGTCPLCESVTIAKCGNRKVWHWSHVSNTMCDSWWENESLWHREWKSYWSEELQEVVQTDETTGEKHIADIKNKQGIVIEIQNSPMSEEELESRENFYKNMIWIINGDKFKKQIDFGAKLPNPDHPESHDLGIQPTIHKDYFMFYKVSERDPQFSLVEMYGSDRIQSLIDESHVGHYLFKWKNPRYVWFKSAMPVFIDFGENILWLLVRFNSNSPFCLKAVSKKQLVEQYSGSINA